MDRRRNLMSISELAQELRITPRTIRYYEEVGLITPIHLENVSQRLYGNRERARLKLILRGKHLGFTLSQIKEMLDVYDIDRNERKQLELALEYGRQRIREIDNKLQELTALKEELLSYERLFMETLAQLDAKSAAQNQQALQSVEQA